MQERPAVSVVIPTRDGDSGLPAALDALERQTLPPADFEVIVVDNTPNGEVAGLVSSIASRSPLNLRYLHEPRKGKSRALRAGISAARGEFIAGTDDDCRPREDWLQVMLEEFRSEPGEVYCLVGKVLPLDGATGWYGVAGQNRSRRVVFQSWLDRARVGVIGNGSNVMYRRRAFEEIGDFLWFLGPGSPTGSGEEVEYFYRILKNHRKIVFLPESVVYHRLSKSLSEYRALERATHDALGATFAYHAVRGDLAAAGWFVSRLIYTVMLSVWLHLKKICVPTSRIHFRFRPDCIFCFVRGFGKGLRGKFD